jgi:tetratricopeptide (TPR) repeat protein
MKMKAIYGIMILAILAMACDQKASQEGETEQQMSTLDSLDMMVRSEPSAQNYLARAEYHLGERDLRKAQIDVDSAYILDDQNTDVLLTRGQVYYFMNQTRYSRDSWEECVSLDPEQWECHMSLAELYFVVRDYRNALTHLNAILAEDGRDETALFLKGNVYREIGDTAQAVLFMQQAVDVDPAYFDALDMLGVLYSQKGSPLCLDYFRRALEVRPNSPDVYYNMGTYYQSENAYNEAIESYLACIELDAGHAFAYYNLGYIHIELQVYSKGVEYFTGAVNSDELYYQAFYGRAYCYEILGDVQNAKKDYETALNINMEYTPAKEGLGRVTRLIED